DVTVERRLFRRAGVLDHDGAYLLREIGMTDESDSQIGIHLSIMTLAEGDDVRLVKRPNQCPGNRVEARGFVGQTDVRPRRNLGRLSAKQRHGNDEYRGDRAERDSANNRTLCGE